MGDQERIPPAPRGQEIWRWIGPGIIWMISAIATGELLFTPRIASLFGYSVLWAMIVAIFLKALVAREIGRWAVVTGSSLLYGIRSFPGPRNWGVWLIIAPQIVVAVTLVAGMAGATGTAVILALPGNLALWGAIFLAVSAGLVLLGRYVAVERASIVMAAIITVALVAAAAVVFPGTEPLASGLVPGFPPDVDFAELLPWLGFMMAGAAGLIWYSYWLAARGYGAAYTTRSEEAEPIAIEALTGEEQERLKGWVRAMTGATVAAATLVLLLLIALLILGSELLRPEGLVPEGEEVTAVLSRLLGDVLGVVGTWLMIAGAFFAFWSTLIANQDGYGRLLGQGSLFLGRQLGGRGGAVPLQVFRYAVIIGLVGIIPAILIILNPEPFEFLSLAGIIEAIQIPVVALAVLFLNSRRLPPALRPSRLASFLTLVAALFFILFAGFFLVTEFVL